MTFHEKAERHEKNRKLAREMKIFDAALSDGSTGVCVLYAWRPIILTADEAYRLADRIADTLESS